jgi:hypothetical protein
MCSAALRSPVAAAFAASRAIVASATDDRVLREGSHPLVAR